MTVCLCDESKDYYGTAPICQHLLMCGQFTKEMGQLMPKCTCLSGAIRMPGKGDNCMCDSAYSGNEDATACTSHYDDDGGNDGNGGGDDTYYDNDCSWIETLFGCGASSIYTILFTLLMIFLF